MPEVILANSQVVAASGHQGPGQVTCTEAEAEAEQFVAAGYAQRAAGT